MASTFAGKNIIIGVTGSIAAFKVAAWVSTLAQEEANVSVIMTRSATQFVAPLTFSSLSGTITRSEMFDEEQSNTISHIQMATETDCVVIAPATAQTISRLAHGMADDLLTTTVLATKAPVIVCPAMNAKMYSHPATQENIDKLRSFGYRIVEPEHGKMACKDEGKGRLAAWNTVQEVLLQTVTKPDLAGHRVLVTAGPTREVIDAARFISNRSSGKMGYALAKIAYRRGAEVTLISGPTSLKCPHGVECIPVQTTAEMYDQVFQHHRQATIIIKSAAVSDFRPKNQFVSKIKKDRADMNIELAQNPDILFELGRKKTKEGPFLVGFCAETDHIVEEGRRKLERKNLDLVCANDIGSKNSGFEADTNRVILIDRDGETRLPLVSKEQTADLIVDRIVKRIG